MDTAEPDVIGHIVSWPPYESSRVVVVKPAGRMDTRLETTLRGAGWAAVNQVPVADRVYRVWAKVGGGAGGEWLPHERHVLLCEASQLVQAAGCNEEFLDDRDATDGWLALLDGLPLSDSRRDHASDVSPVEGDLPAEDEDPVTVRLLRPLLLTGASKGDDGYILRHWVVPVGTVGNAWNLFAQVRISIAEIDGIDDLHQTDLMRDWSEFYGPAAWFLVLDKTGAERVPPDYYLLEAVSDGVVDAFRDPWDKDEAETLFAEWVETAGTADRRVEVSLYRTSRPSLTWFTPPENPTLRIRVKSVVVGGA